MSVSVKMISPGSNRIADQEIQLRSTKLEKMRNGENASAIQKQETQSNLKDIKNRYMSSFTMHALNHIVEGTLLEKILWTLKLLVALGIAVYLAWNFFVAFYNYEVSTTIKNIPKMSMRLPILYLCGEGYTRYLTKNLYNCFNGSKYYNHRNCIDLRRRHPDWYRGGTKFCKDGEDYDRVCTRNEPLLMNQCIVINPELKFMQKDSTEHMNRLLSIPIQYDKNHKNHHLKNNNNNQNNINNDVMDFPFPLHLWVSPVEAVWQWGSGTYKTRIDGPGKYEFTLEKTKIKRLPAPYSRPSCIKDGSIDALEKNLLIGLYTRRKCEDTCVLKNRWLKCGVVPYVYRNYIRDKEYLKQYLNETIDPDAYKSCWQIQYRRTGALWNSIRNCKATCYQPCNEERYRITEISHPWKSHQLQKQQSEGIQKVQLSVYYRELMEMEVKETPSYDRVTLLANFGGMLGLMTGMSALSVFEILIWFLLCIIIFVRHKI